ncbi:MAG: FixH family protein [Salaquimonas sp.]
MKKIIIGIVAIIILLGSFMAFKMLQSPPDDLDLRTEHLSENGLYLVSFVPEKGVPREGPIHAWLATIKTKTGKLVAGATVTLDGGMPQHGHGLPTSPSLEDEIAPGVYRIDGVKFSMSGWWEFKLDIESEDGTDRAVFNVVLD